MAPKKRENNGSFFLPNNPEGNLEGNEAAKRATIKKASEGSIDLMLAEELNKLSFQEREVISDEIHGIAVPHEENPTILTKAFRNLDGELEKLCKTKGDTLARAFCKSQELSSTYLNTKELRIMFLRCDRFDCQKAAERLCRFAELMYELYGDIGLERLAKLSDLEDEEMEVMRQGHCQVLPHRDRAGRKIYTFFSSDTFDVVPHKTKFRILAYVFMAMLDESTQQKGIVGLLWYKHLDIHACLARAKLNEMVVNILPIRFGAIHTFFPSKDTYQNGFFGYLAAGIAQQVKPYMRIHSGSMMESIYIIESFGILSHQIPLQKSTFQVEVTNHHRWLDLRIAQENTDLPMQIIECPTNSDILFGRGIVLMNHPGNILYRNFIQSKLPEYANITSKKDIWKWTLEMVCTLKKEYGVRFLREEKIGQNITTWVEATDDLARSKLRIAFRDARRRRLEKSNGTTTASHSKVDDKRDFGRPLTSDDDTPLMHSEGGDIAMIQGDTAPLATTLLNRQQQQRMNNSIASLDNRVRGLNSIASLDNRVRGLNNTIESLFPQQISDSSTSTFLGMDGSSKRPRLCEG